MTDTNRTPPPGEFSGDKLAMLAQLMADEGIDAGSAATIVARPRPAAIPLSFAQELVWLLDRASPGLTAYNSGLARRIRGPLDVDAFQRALDAVAARHEVLRTTYASPHDHAVQVIHPAGRVPLAMVDLTSTPAADREAEARRRAIAAIRTPFDLAAEAQFRATLIRIDRDDHVLAIGLHHISSDGWSRGVLFRELGHAYEAIHAGLTPAFAPLPLQYADFAIWQREHLAGARLDTLLDYWRSAIGDADTELSLPTDFARPAHAGFEGAQLTMLLPADLTAGIRGLLQKEQVTLYMLLLAAYQTVLHRWTGQFDVLTGSPVAGRSLAETDGAIGYYANTLVMHGRFGDDPSFSDLLARFRDTALGAYEHQDVPLEKLVLELRDSQQRLSAAPLFHAVLTMHDMATGDLRLADLTLESVGMESDSSKFDLTLIVGDRPDAIRFTLHYRTDLFREETARRFLGHVRRVLEAAVADSSIRVSRIPLLTPEEQAELAAWNTTAIAGSGSANIVELFERQAARHHDAVALVGNAPDGSRTSLTYAELNARANQLAVHLRANGAASGARVGLLLDRNADAIVAMLGILKAGACYVPLSLEAPAARIAQQLGECRAAAVVTLLADADRIPEGIVRVVLDRDAALIAALGAANSGASTDANAIAYILYTSGSTGVPKGVAVTHANVAHYTRAVSRALNGAVPLAGDPLDSNQGRRFGLASTLAADLGNTALFPALLGGGTLHVLSQATTTEPARFAEYLRDQGLDVLKITPNHWQALIAGKTGAELAAVMPRQWLIFGGEALRPEVARLALAAGTCRVLNHYGPTETTVGACTFEVTPASLDAVAALGARTVPLGRPLANATAFIVDAFGNEQPVGVPGELFLGGAGVAVGYVERPELTAERFVQFRNARVYRTGDRARRLANGSIEFLGRNDHQVKVRGYRVELGEIEQVIREHAAVAQCAVLLIAQPEAEPQLMAYVVPRATGYAAAHADRLNAQQVRDWIAERLPSYMIPSAVVMLEQLPLTRNGKLDRAALAALAATASAEGEFVAPRTATEQGLATIWCEVLKLEKVSVRASFLELGGHSLLAIRVLGRVSKVFGVRLPLRTLFEAPTIAQLAEAVESAAAAGAPATAAPSITARARDAHRIQVPTEEPRS